MERRCRNTLIIIIIIIIIIINIIVVVVVVIYTAIAAYGIIYSCVNLVQAVNKDNVKYTPGLTHTSEALQQARINLHSEGEVVLKKTEQLI